MNVEYKTINTKNDIVDEATGCCITYDVGIPNPPTLFRNLDTLLGILDAIDAATICIRRAIWNNEDGNAVGDYVEVIDMDTHILRCIEVSRNIETNIHRIRDGIA